MQAKTLRLFLISLLATSILQAQDEGIFIIGNLGGAIGGLGQGVSADGSVAVGFGFSASGQEAFSWTQAGGSIGLGDLAGGTFQSVPFGVSADGSVIVGHSDSNDATEAFRWTAESGMIGLGNYPGAVFVHSGARGVSADGSVIVGFGNHGLMNEAFRWTELDGMVGLGDLPGGFFNSSAMAVSADGSVVVGLGDSTDGPEAFRWTQVDGMTGLGDLLGGAFNSVANGVSADGLTIVGHGTSADGTEAFRWTEAGGMVGLGDLPGGTFSSSASDVSHDGSVIVGGAQNADGARGFRWTQAGGMQTIGDWLASTGVPGANDVPFEIARAVSDDGTVVVGATTTDNGFEPWLARGGSGAIVMTDFMESVAPVAAVPGAVASLPGTIMSGAHHHVLGATDFGESESTAWITGDIAEHDRHEADFWFSEVGAAHRIDEQLTLGFGVGTGHLEQDLMFNGSHELDGQYLMAEIGYQVPDTKLLLSLTGIYGFWEEDVTRGYLNAGTPDQSSGDTEVDTASLRVRADLLDLFSVGEFTLTPRVSFSVTNVEVNGYSESGGGFPAMFDDQTHTSEEFRIGFTIERPVSERTHLRALFDAVYRLDDGGEGITGQVIGLFAFNVPGEEIDQEWVRGGVEVEHRLTDSTFVTGSFFAATEGESPDVSGSLSLRFVF